MYLPYLLCITSSVITFVFLPIFLDLTGGFSVGPFILSNTSSLKDLLSLKVHAGTQVLPASEEALVQVLNSNTEISVVEV